MQLHEPDKRPCAPHVVGRTESVHARVIFIIIITSADPTDGGAINSTRTETMSPGVMGRRGPANGFSQKSFR